ncbi:MAG: spore coat protein U domain-containing protein [Pseudomonadota bacterium]|nr:spore coat protein U domain-containing protein [Pseudomonadota bacterium]
MKPARTFLLAGALALLGGGAQAAVSCSATMSQVAFGNVDLLEGTDMTATGTLSYTCTNDDRFNAVRVNLCLLIDGGQGSQAQFQPRFMRDGAGNALPYNLFLPGGVLWTTNGYGYATPYSPPVFTIAAAPFVGGVASASGSVAITGRMLATPTSASPGSYAVGFGGGSTSVAWEWSNTRAAAPASCGGNQPVRFPFAVSATVVPRCQVQVDTLDFGVGGLLTANVDAASSLRATCTLRTPYQIGLDNGQNALGNVRRMAGPGGDFISYELYRDSARTQRWGNAVGVDTLSTGTIGSGAATSHTLWGRVPPQAVSPTPGNYSDTVTVTVTY